MKFMATLAAISIVCLIFGWDPFTVIMTGALVVLGLAILFTLVMDIIDSEQR
jgi:hypothetical protein